MTISVHTYKKIYELLADVTPLEYDCGQLCGSICCHGGQDLGIYLYPGEEKLFSGEEDWLEWEVHQVSEYDFPPSWQGTVDFIVCTKFCPRDKRPLQCRFFPLTAHLDQGGLVHIILDSLNLPYECPLISQRMELRPDFVERVYEAWLLLLTDDKIRDLVLWDSKARERDPNFIPEIVRSQGDSPQ
ncbi:MAG: hypothetical protein GX349_04405 [Firmicutes bacterium]|nr:hypothetical protein [Bacillota bacterium]